MIRATRLLVSLLLVALSGCPSEQSPEPARSTRPRAKPTTASPGPKASGGIPLPYGENIAVWVTDTGHTLYTRRGASAGAKTPSELTRRARTWKRLSKKPSADGVAKLYIDSHIPYQRVIATIDALREDDQGRLYPSVAFGMTPDQTPPSSEADAGVGSAPFHPTDVLERTDVEGLIIVVSKTAILLGEEGESVLRLPGRDEATRVGVGAAHKTGGAKGLFIEPLAKRVREAKKELRSDAILIADQSTPWRVVLEILHTLGRVAVPKYHLMVMKKVP